MAFVLLKNMSDKTPNLGRHRRRLLSTALRCGCRQITHSFPSLLVAARAQTLVWLCLATLTGFLILAGPVSASHEELLKISKARPNEAGWLVYTVDSPHQAGQTDIRVLPPEQAEEGKQFPVVYILPVEPGRGTRWGDGMREVVKHNLHNKHDAIFVFPTFSTLPWYADHPTNPTIRQETYFMQVVVPFVEANYPTSQERFLLGFSKSGWGAWVLLLRHPNAFCRAAAWDAPLMMEQIGKYGTSEIFGTQKTFQQYRPADLLRENAENLRNGEIRLILTGYGNFREHHHQAHTLLEDLKIPHVYQDGPQRQHEWHSGWLAEAVDLLLSKSN